MHFMYLEPMAKLAQVMEAQPNKVLELRVRIRGFEPRYAQSLSPMNLEIW